VSVPPCVVVANTHGMFIDGTHEGGAAAANSSQRAASSRQEQPASNKTLEINCLVDRTLGL